MLTEKWVYQSFTTPSVSRQNLSHCLAAFQQLYAFVFGHSALLAASCFCAYQDDPSCEDERRFAVKFYILCYEGWYS